MNISSGAWQHVYKSDKLYRVTSLYIHTSLGVKKCQQTDINVSVFTCNIGCFTFSILAQDARQPTGYKKYSIVKLYKNTTAETEQSEHHK